MTLKKQVFLIFLLAFGSSLFSQSLEPVVIGSSGHQGQGENYRMAWTIGETVIATFAAGDMILTQGFHQGELLVTAIDEPPADNHMVAFPNPANDFVNLKVENPDGLEYMLFDMGGRMIKSERLSGDITSIPFYSLGTGTYFIKVMHGSKEIRTFKIIKN